MFHTARSSARTLLLAAGTAGFVALGAGIAGADTLGGVTDGLPLGDLHNQVPTALTEGVTTPLGDLVKVQPGELSAQPELQHQSAEVQHQSDPVGSIVGDTVSTDTLSTDAPLRTGEDNAANVGPLDLGTATDTLPLSDTGGAVDPLSMLLGGTDLLGGTGLLDGLALDGGGLPLGGGTLPMSAPASPINLEQGAAVVDDTVTELGSRAGTGLHEPSLGVVGLDDLDVAQLGETVPMSDPVGLDAGENADLTGGVTTLLPQDLQGTLPMNAPEDLEVVGAVVDAVDSTLGDLGDGVDGLGLEDLGAEETLPLSATDADLVGTVLSENALPETPGGDLIGVQGLPELGEPEVATLPLAEELPAGDLPFDLPAELPVELPLAVEQLFAPVFVS
ncbi:hypothetical protein NE857_01595 [Nocardiopsis exhalans]|uniref:Uncharacterized protein n=1 Tax=Nocardiopsis exhalans TaxID=163604 RepID=A0ABY5DBD6_9ACTN|nr:hypothetical protein [Nocardiopsis exhalans]USY20383.1 hypothetical protein NE857_01595 [Nocardiopsis exhalans]